MSNMAPEPPRICVVGSTNIDLTFRTPRLPRPGETLTGHGFHLGHGGKGANQAVMAARLGARVAIVSRVGRDVFGERALRNYREQEIDTTFVGQDERAASGLAAIVVDDAAANCILVVPGANHALTPEHVREAAPAICRARLLLCQIEVPLETTLEAFRLAKAAGVRTLFNPAPAAPLPDELLRLTDLCVPNETELELVTSQPVATLEQVEVAARTLVGRGPATVIATLGSRGVLLVNAQGAEHIPAVPVRAVDPTGAGDAFIGALAVSVAEGRTLDEAARWANAVAALSVTRLGAQDALPSWAEVEAFVRSQGSDS
jgi:ribokinase